MGTDAIGTGLRMPQQLLEVRRIEPSRWGLSFLPPPGRFGHRFDRDFFKDDFPVRLWFKRHCRMLQQGAATMRFMHESDGKESGGA